MLKCEGCGKEVIVSPDKEYIYVKINIGLPGKEKYMFFHIDCFEKNVKKKTRLYKKVEDALAEWLKHVL